MSKTYICPAEICALFDNEETVEQGANEACDWANSLPTLMGDKIILPDGHGGMVELTQTTPGMQ